MSLQIVNGVLSIVDGYTLIEPTHQSAIFGFGETSVSVTSITNTFSSPGVMSSDRTSVASPRYYPAAAGYGGDKAIIGFGGYFYLNSLTNLISNTGIVAADTAGVAYATTQMAAASYGGDRAIFGFGTSDLYDITNHTYLVSNTGVMSSTFSAVGTSRTRATAAGYGGDKAIFAYGLDELNYPLYSTTKFNLVSNTGVVAADSSPALGSGYLNGIGASGVAATYDRDKAIFAWGYTALNSGNFYNSQTYSLVSNTGVFVTSGTTVFEGRSNAGSSTYDTDKAVFAFGRYLNAANYTNYFNLITNTGVISANYTAASATARNGCAAAPYGG